MTTVHTHMPELMTSSIHPASRACIIPPELLARVVSFVGNDKLLLGDNGRDINVPGRREEIQHLAACTLVCVYWAKVARPRMLNMLVVRSLKDIHGLRDYFSSSNTVLSIHDIPSIARCLRILVIEYRLGDWAWFHNVQGLANARDEYQTLYSSRTPQSTFHLQINVSSTPISMESTGRAGFRSARHPLFFATPKPIPMPCSSAFDTTSITLKDIHFTEFRTLQNLVQDFNLFLRTLTADRRPRRSPRQVLRAQDRLQKCHLGTRRDGANPYPV
ncbi:hypothetical protein BC629DRAFT_132159 [Irpex lacteus]|nr:hypothetical protein BC629DRAFT_132159 [Irpex lacteus]